MSDEMKQRVHYWLDQAQNDLDHAMLALDAIKGRLPDNYAADLVTAIAVTDDKLSKLAEAVKSR